MSWVAYLLGELDGMRSLLQRMTDRAFDAWLTTAQVRDRQCLIAFEQLEPRLLLSAEHIPIPIKDQTGEVVWDRVVVEDISIDGSIAVGWAVHEDDGVQAFRYTRGDNYIERIVDLAFNPDDVPQELVDAGMQATGVSAVGIVGTTQTQTMSWFWSLGRGFSILEPLADGSRAEAFDISDTGVIVGSSSSSVGQRAVTWTLAGGTPTILRGLPRDPDDGLFDVASAISEDGSTIVGSSTNAQGEFRPVSWSPGGTANELSGDGRGWANGVTADGSGITGQLDDEAVVWRNGQLTVIGDFPGGRLDAAGNDLSDDGETVFGYGYSFELDGSDREVARQNAFLYDDDDGLRDFRTEVLLPAGFRGITDEVIASNAEGDIVVGTTRFRDLQGVLQQVSWMTVFPSPDLTIDITQRGFVKPLESETTMPVTREVGFTVNNEGDAAVSENVRVSFYISDDDVLDDGDRALDGVSIDIDLQPGESSDHTYNLTIPTGVTVPDNPFLIAEVDSADVVREIDHEFNNDGAVQIGVFDLFPFALDGVELVFDDETQSFMGQGTFNMGLSERENEQFKPLIQVLGNVVISETTISLDGTFAPLIGGLPGELFFGSMNFDYGMGVDFQAEAVADLDNDDLTGRNPIRPGGLDITVKSFRFVNPSGGSTTDAYFTITGNFGLLSYEYFVWSSPLTFAREAQMSFFGTPENIEDSSNRITLPVLDLPRSEFMLGSAAFSVSAMTFTLVSQATEQGPEVRGILRGTMQTQVLGRMIEFNLSDPNSLEFVSDSGGNFRIEFNGVITTDPINMGFAQIKGLELFIDSRGSDFLIRGRGEVFLGPEPATLPDRRLGAIIGVDVRNGYIDGFILGITNLAVPFGSSGIELNSASIEAHNLSTADPAWWAAGSVGVSDVLANAVPTLPFFLLPITIPGGVIGRDNHLVTTINDLMTATGTVRLGPDELSLSVAGKLLTGDDNFRLADFDARLAYLPPSNEFVLGGSLSILPPLTAGGRPAPFVGTAQIRLNVNESLIGLINGRIRIPEGSMPWILSWLEGATAEGTALARFDWANDNNVDFVALWGRIAGAQRGIKYGFDGSFEILGRREIQDLNRGLAPASLALASNAASVPAAPPAMGRFNVTSADSTVVFGAEWENADPDAVLELIDPDGNVLTEADVLADPKMDLPSQPISDTTRAIVVTDPMVGEWQVRLVSALNPPQSITYMADGIATPGAIALTNLAEDKSETTDKSINIAFTGTAGDPDARVSLFYDTDRDQHDGMIIAADIPLSQGSYDWNLADVTAGEYFVYAVLEDGTNVPVISDYATGKVTVELQEQFIPDPVLPIGDRVTLEEDALFAAIALQPDGDYVLLSALPGADFDPESEDYATVYAQRYDSDNNAIGDRFSVREIYLPDTTPQEVDVATNAVGDIAAMFRLTETFTDPDYILSTLIPGDGGAWINVGSGGGRNDGTIGLTPDGSIAQAQNLPPNDNIFAFRYDHNDRRFTDYKFFFAQPDDESTWDLAVDDDGVNHLVYTDARFDFGLGRDVRSVYYQNDQFASFEVTQFNTGDAILPSIDIDNRGNFVVAWAEFSDTIEGDDEYGNFVLSEGWLVKTQLIDGDRRRVGDEIVVTQLEHQPEYISVGFDDAGEFVVAWDEKTESAGAGEFAEGESTPTHERMTNIQRYEYLEPRQPVQDIQASYNGEGELVVAWDALPDVHTYFVNYTPDAAGEFYSETVIPGVGNDNQIILRDLNPGETYRITVDAMLIDETYSLEATPIVAIAGPTPTVPPEADEWEVFALGGTRYVESIGLEPGDTATLQEAIDGASINSATGQFIWDVPAGTSGWTQVIVNIDRAGGGVEQVRRHLLSDPLPSASISGTVALDAEPNGEVDETDTPIEGATVYVDLNNNGQLDRTRTFSFTDIPGQVMPGETEVFELVINDAIGTIFDVDPFIDVFNNSLSNVTIDLISPTGTQVQLLGPAGLLGADLTLTFDDAADDALGSLPAPFSGTVRPAEPLADLNGEDPNGVWELRIVNASGDTVRLSQWELNIALSQALEPTVETDALGQFAITGLTPGEYTLRLDSQPGQQVTGAGEDGYPFDQGDTGTRYDFAVQQVFAPPVILRSTIDNGTAQRSVIRSITVTFDQPVSIDLGAFHLIDAHDRTPAVDVTNPSGDMTTYQVAFPNGGGDSGLLEDDLYRLTIAASKVRNLAGDQMAADHVLDFHRLAGDSDGDRDTDRLDLRNLTRSLGKSAGEAGFNVAFELNGDDVVDRADLLIMAGLLNQQLPAGPFPTPGPPSAPVSETVQSPVFELRQFELGEPTVQRIVEPQGAALPEENQAIAWPLLIDASGEESTDEESEDGDSLGDLLNLPDSSGSPF